MPRAYCLSGEDLETEISKLPWLTFPPELCELLVICDVEGHPRHFRSYVSTATGKRLLEGSALLSVDAALALVKAARCRGLEYDLTSPFETEVAGLFDRINQLAVDGAIAQIEAVYQVVKDHVVTAVKLRSRNAGTVAGGSPARCALPRPAGVGR